VGKIKTYDIPGFLKYINVNGTDNDAIQVIRYDDHPNLLLKSPPVHLNFYLIAIKNNIEVQPPIDEMSSTYLFLDKPGNSMEWDLSCMFSGYGIFVNEALLKKSAKDYSFMGYNRHEALFLTLRESEILYDLFIKAFEEYKQKSFSQAVLVSYTALILSYTQTFYERQFQSRGKTYNKVVADFYEQLDAYFQASDSMAELPSVSYFAEKANLTANYFGDVIKHFTGHSPMDHIHQHVIQSAKTKLRQTKLTINEIAYSLGFEYPTYFTRFFREKTGISPKAFRNQ